jgi:hypothetical protein
MAKKVQDSVVSQEEAQNVVSDSFNEAINGGSDTDGTGDVGVEGFSEDGDGFEGVGFEGGDGDGDSEGGLLVDMSGVDENADDFPAIPRGMYASELDQLEYTTSSKGNKMWTTRWRIEGGEYDGRTVFYHVVFNEKMLKRAKQFLMRIQMSDGSDYAKQLANRPFNPETVAMEGRLLGAKARLRLDTRVYEGKLRNNVRDVLPPAEGGDGFMES